jgi:hypothetical protein
MRRPLVGRAEDLRAVTAMLLQADVGLVTLTGPGGLGKTTLALAAAHAVAGQFADGVAFISLETLTDPALIRDTAVRQLGIPTSPGQTVDESLLTWATPRLPRATPTAPTRNSKRAFASSGPSVMTCPAASCSAASHCSPHSGATTTRPGPGSLKACSCCAAAETSGTWPCSC